MVSHCWPLLFCHWPHMSCHRRRSPCHCCWLLILSGEVVMLVARSLKLATLLRVPYSLQPLHTPARRPYAVMLRQESVAGCLAPNGYRRRELATNDAPWRRDVTATEEGAGGRISCYCCYTLRGVGIYKRSRLAVMLHVLLNYATTAPLSLRAIYQEPREYATLMSRHWRQARQRQAVGLACYCVGVRAAVYIYIITTKGRPGLPPSRHITDNNGDQLMNTPHHEFAVLLTPSEGYHMVTTGGHVTPVASWNGRSH